MGCWFWCSVVMLVRRFIQCHSLLVIRSSPNYFFVSLFFRFYGSWSFGIDFVVTEYLGWIIAQMFTKLCTKSTNTELLKSLTHH